MGRGFYLLDEPETGLSLSTQLQLMVLMQDLVQRDSQFVIATHSPILLFFPKATIYEFMNGDIVKRKLEETKIYQDWATIFERKEHFFQKLFES
ncbi:AAA family ATPase [Candidatus Enterococcus lemimoniae]|uniref:AAA family ATPase n=1 Tax=Candidatus Enterococcus lemimoniae TaxID=1834167 RepID=UPI0020CD7F48|nr:AAA family ATPase [Enterococcus sp. 12C11_DIV0727]